jgi:hypothetical protein
VLSPEVSREKSEIAIQYRIDEATDHAGFRNRTTENEVILLLKSRILAVKQQRIQQVDIPDSDYLREVYLANTNSLQPRHSRDFHRFKCLIAGFATFNYLWRKKKDDNTLIATMFDIDQAGILWKELSEPQELGLTPYVLTLYREIIVPAYIEHQESGSSDGCSIKDIRNYHFKVKNEHVNEKYLRSQIIPQLETAGLIELSQDITDKRVKRITPVYGITNNENNSTSGVGVKEEMTIMDAPHPSLNGRKRDNDNYECSPDDDPHYGVSS